MKTRVIVGLLAVGLALAYPIASMARVKGTPHEITGKNGIAVPHAEICRPCHTPHQANSAAGPLWNHALSNATYTLWEGADVNSVINGGSRLCLSCHDGTVAIDSYGGIAGSVMMDGRNNIGTDLTNSHPIGVMYPTSGTRYNLPNASGQIIDSVETPAGQYARLEDGRIQCSSCHRVHDNTRGGYGMFLRVDNTGSRLCMTCHLGQ